MLHFKLRQVSFPFYQLVKIIPKQGKLLDVGCGFGYLIKLLAERNSQQNIFGYDISPEKIRVAGRLLRKYKNVRLSWPKSKVDIITVIDVLYLLTDSQKLKLLRKLGRKLRRAGKLIIATVPKEPSWEYYLAWLQEWLMVKLLGKTESQEKVISFETENWLRQKLQQAGFRQVKRYQLPGTLFFWHKHVVFVATK